MRRPGVNHATGWRIGATLRQDAGAARATLRAVSEPKTPIVLMVGTDEATRGGISSVVGVLRRQGLLDRWCARYVPTHREGSTWTKILAAGRGWLAASRLLAARRVGLLHVHTASGPSFWRKSLFVAAAQWWQVPYVLHVHGGGFQRFYDERCGRIGRRWVRRVLRRSVAVLALSADWQQIFEAMAPGCRCVVVPNGVEIPAHPSSLIDGAPTVIFMGQLSEAKGVADLAQAWPGVVAAIPDARLVLAGSGDVQAWRLRFGNDDSVEFAGWITGPQKEALLRAAWAFVLPSHVEALPMAVLESMAAGVPVVATRVGGVPSAVTDGDTGLLIEPRDVAALRSAIISLLTDRERRLQLGAAGRQRAVEVFSVETQARRIEAVWRGAGIRPCA